MVEENDSSSRATVRTVGIILVACAAGATALYFGREFFIPIALAMLLDALLSPVVRALKRVHVPTPAGATIVVLGLLGLMVGAAVLLTQPVRDWAAQAPGRFAVAEEKLNKLPGPLKRAVDAARHAGGATPGGHGEGGQGAQAPQAPSGGPAAAPVPPAGGTQVGGTEVGGAVFRFFGATLQVLGMLVEVLVLLLLMLGSGDLFLRKLVTIIPRLRDKEAAVEAAGEARLVVGRYLLVNALINAGQGALIALVMWWLKMPAPLLWGVFTFVLEFIPYLGAAVMIGLLAVVALAAFDNPGHALLAPASYLLIATLQNNLVSPIAYGRRLQLNAVAVFVGVMFWWFLWGVPGAFLAVPILATVKIIADRTESLRPLGVFLGE